MKLKHKIFCFILLVSCIIVFVFCEFSIFEPYVKAQPEGEWLKRLSEYDLFINEYFNRHGRIPPKAMDKWYSFAKANGVSVEHEAFEKIYKDLDFFRKRHDSCVRAGSCNKADPVISQSDIEYAAEMERMDILTIRNGTFITGGKFSITIRKALEDLVKWLPDMTIVINELDEPRVLHKPSTKDDIANLKLNSETKIWNFASNAVSILPLMNDVCDFSIDGGETHSFFLAACSFDVTNKQVPVFSSTSIPGCFGDISIPNYFFWDNALLQPWAHSVQWGNKENVIHWRGSTTGGSIREGTPWRDFPRFRLLKQFQNITEVSGIEIDIGMTGVVQCEGQSCADVIRDYGEPVPQVSHQAAFANKYLIDIDGNTFSLRFLAFLRNSGSLIFKITLFEDWVTALVKPWVHYIPVKMDLSDLEEKIKWAAGHEREAAQIAENARNFAESKLRRVDIQAYLFRLLLEYHALTLSN